MNTRLYCHKSSSDFENLDDRSNTFVCMPVIYDQWYREMSQLKTMGINGMCTQDVVDFVTLTFREDKYFAIVGCRNLTDNKHEEGAWILVPSADISNIEVEFLDGLIDTVLNKMPPLSSTKTNFQIVDFQQGKRLKLFKVS